MTDLNEYAYNAITGLNISDLHKDARGTRPRIDFNDGTWTEASINEFHDSLVEELKYNTEDETRREEAALKAYNDHLAKLMADYDLDLAAAFRWDMQAEEVDSTDKQDITLYLFNKRLGFADIDRLAKTITELAA